MPQIESIFRKEHRITCNCVIILEQVLDCGCLIRCIRYEIVRIQLCFAMLSRNCVSAVLAKVIPSVCERVSQHAVSAGRIIERVRRSNASVCPAAFINDVNRFSGMNKASVLRPASEEVLRILFDQCLNR